MTDSPARSTTGLPLAGVKVVEFCQIAAGPFCGMLLTDFGAQVVKIEPPEGDGLRQWPPIRNGYSENFASLNRGKRSIRIDLKSDAGREVLLRLVREYYKFYEHLNHNC